MIAIGIAATGGADSPAWIYLFFVVVFAAYFYRPPVARLLHRAGRARPGAAARLRPPRAGSGLHRPAARRQLGLHRPGGGDRLAARRSTAAAPARRAARRRAGRAAPGRHRRGRRPDRRGHLRARLRGDGPRCSAAGPPASCDSTRRPGPDGRRLVGRPPGRALRARPRWSRSGQAATSTEAIETGHAGAGGRPPARTARWTGSATRSSIVAPIRSAGASGGCSRSPPPGAGTA